MPLRPLLTIVSLALIAVPSETGSQTPAPYAMKVNVDEVTLTFHAADTSGKPVTDLRPEELKILDNDRPPRRIVDFQAMRNLPIRAAILVDTSSSMEKSLPSIHNIATTYAQRILEQKTDQAMVMSFGKRLNMQQPWSSNPAALAGAIQRTGVYPSTTALYDNLYAVCRYQFGALPRNATGNFIMLFSDGEDDASYLPLQSAVDMCQQTNTVIYAFRPENADAGLRNLSQLATLTGGRVFRDGASSTEIEEDLRMIQASLRDQYRVIYNPSALKRDGSFHRVVILPPDRVAQLSTRSGYYAPAH
jgi:VWFA-related protein